MKSWVSFLLPKDEYKEKKLLQFISEGGVLLFLYLVAMLFASLFFSLSVELVLLFGIAVYLFYVFGRYILSGIEYTDVATEQDYKKELKASVAKMATFGIFYLVIYLIIVDIPKSGPEWLEIIGFVLFLCLIWFITSFISLKRSYKKNQELM